MSSASGSVTDLVALYDELVLEGRAPDPETFCADHPNHPKLLERIKDLARLRGDLDKLFGDAVPSKKERELPEIPGFQIGRPLGSGGMGTVYLAEQLSPRRSCALKLLDHTGATALDRFRREADLAARLNHPAVATVYAFGVANNQAYLVNEWVHGFSLQALLRAADAVSPEDPNDWFVEAVRRVSEGYRSSEPSTTAAPVKAMVGLAVQIADALAHAHRRGVIHRDVKPSNIIVGLDGSAKLIDFGIAVATENTEERFTRTGTFIGSHGYAAPEQLRGELTAVGSWTDTYALGATLFEMLTQRTPFESPTYADRLARASEPPQHGPRHYNPKVSRALDALVMRAMRPEPHERFHDGEEIAEALRACPIRPSILPALPSHWLARVLPSNGAQLIALLAAIAAISFGVLFADSRREVDELRADRTAAELLSGNEVLDFVLRDERTHLQRCLLHDRRLLAGSGGRTMAARLMADIQVEMGIVRDVTIATGTSKMGMRSQQCMADVLRGLELPGVGFRDPVTLRLDLRVTPKRP